MLVYKTKSVDVCTESDSLAATRSTGRFAQRKHFGSHHCRAQNSLAAGTIVRVLCGYPSGYSSSLCELLSRHAPPAQVTERLTRKKRVGNIDSIGYIG